jgi:tRNA dimethylallyltransferase
VPEHRLPPKLVVLFGPTALGKTAIAVELAERLSGEIVTADSMQVYAGLPILTNQPTAEQAARVRHHLVGFVDPGSEFSAAEYARLAQATIDGLLARGRRVILEGGSGLYVRAALGGLSFGPAPDAALRASLEERLRREGLAALGGELARKAPQLAAHVDLANPRRVLRALEMLALGGAQAEPEARRQLWLPGSRYEYTLLALDADRDYLRRRIDARVDEMMAAGAVAELQAVLARAPLSRTLRQAIGVRELAAYLDGSVSLDEAAAQTKARTRRLVRRQLTWMRKLPGAATISVTGESAGAVAARAMALLGS